MSDRTSLWSEVLDRSPALHRAAGWPLHRSDVVAPAPDPALVARLAAALAADPALAEALVAVLARPIVALVQRVTAEDVS